MATSKLCGSLSGMLAVGALVLSARTVMTKAASTTALTGTYRATEAIGQLLRSKRAIGYFPTVKGQCELTLMVAEAVDSDRAVLGSAARLHFAAQRAALASEEGPQMMLVCGAGAATVEVAGADTRS